MLIKNFKHLKEMVEEAGKERFISVDLETTGLDYVSDDVIGVGIAVQKKEWYIDFETLYPLVDNPTIARGTVWRQLAHILDVNKHTLISHNAPFDMYFIHREFTQVLQRDMGYFKTALHWWDTLSMAALVDENLIGVRIDIPAKGGETRKVGALSLKALSRIYLDRQQRMYDPGFEEWPAEERAEYGCADVRNTYDLAITFSQVLSQRHLLTYYQKYVAPMSFVSCALEGNGIKVDVPRLLEVQEEVQSLMLDQTKELQQLVPPIEEITYNYKQYPGTDDELRAKLDRVIDTLPIGERNQFRLKSGKPSLSRSRLAKLANTAPDVFNWGQVQTIDYTPFNPNSTQQLGAFLIEQGYRLPLTTHGNPSVAESVLTKLKADYPKEVIWDSLFTLRTLKKLQSSYVGVLLECAWEDNTVHPEWHSAGTVTGRYSATKSSKNKELVHKRGPALQTIPRPDTLEEGGWKYNPRKWFIAHKGNVLCVADLGQAEVRMLAVRSGDPQLKAAILAGKDIHSSVAALIYGRRWHKASAKQQKVLRVQAKTVTFGTMYGMGPQTLADRLEITENEARDILSSFYRAFPQVQQWKINEGIALSQRGYTTSFLGRRRSPVIIQLPPKVTAPPKTPAFQQQTLQVELWRREYDLACRKSGFDITGTEFNLRLSRAKRQVVNFEIQGSIAELINYGMWRLLRAGYALRGQIHDEVVVELSDNERSKAALTALLKELFEVTLGGIPFTIDIQYGQSWACGKE